MIAPDARDGTFIVRGGRALTGRVAPAGNKNEALPTLAASLLVPGVTRIENLPRIEDMFAMVRILESVGVQAKWHDDHALSLDASEVTTDTPDPAVCKRIRGSLLMVPGLLHRRGRALLPQPGGDRIGRRRVDTHLLALRQLGAEAEARLGEYELKLNGRFRGADVWLDEASVMATE